jgi:hypothetical protein
VIESHPLPAAPRRRSPLRRILKVGVVLASIVIVAIAFLPTLLSMDWARHRVERQLSAALGSEVTIGGYSFGWFSGLSIDGVAVRNPAGFPVEEKLFEMRALRGDTSIASAVRGRFEVTGSIEGLAIRVRQKADGTTNFQELLGTAPGVRVDTGPGERPRPDRTGTPVDLRNLRLDLELRDAFVEVFHEEKGVLERLENMRARVSKAFDTPVATIEFSCDLHRPGTEQKGRVELRIDAQADPDAPIDAHLNCIGLDLTRYRPIVDSFVSADQLEAFAGIITANAKITGVPTEVLTIEGLVEVDQPHFGGALLQGMDIRAPRWTLRPNFTATLSGDAPKIDSSRFEADFGFLKLRGLPGAGEVFGLGFDLDVSRLAETGGPFPAMLKDSGTTVTGSFTAPLRADFAGLAPAEMIAQLGFQAAVAVRELGFADQLLQGLKADIGLQGGKLSVVSSTGSLNGGALTMRVEADATKLDQPPLSLAFGVDGAQVASSAVGALQYAVPLFAGLSGAAGAGLPVELQSRGGLQLELSGTAFPKEGQSVLDWLNGWAGRGELGLQDGSFRPAPQLAGLMQLTGESGKLSFHDLSTKFRIAEGFVETSLMKLSAKGRDFGIAGRTSLAGGIDYTIDVRDVLRQHSDGRKILEYLGDTPVGAKLAGTLAAPALAMPDFGKLAEDALRAGLEQEARKAIEKEAGGLLEKVLGPKKGKDGEQGGAEDDAKKAVEGLLRGILDPERGAGGADGTSIEEQAKTALDGVLKGILGPGPTPPAVPKPAVPKTLDPKAVDPGQADPKKKEGEGTSPPPSPPPPAPPANPLQKLLEEALRKKQGGGN